MSARTMDQTVVNNHGAFIWRIANLLRGTCKPAQYGPVILPFVVLRRLDCLVEPAEGETLVKQLFDGETKRVDYFHSLISLRCLEAARVGDAG